MAAASDPTRRNADGLRTSECDVDVVVADVNDDDVIDTDDDDNDDDDVVVAPSVALSVALSVADCPDGWSPSVGMLTDKLMPPIDNGIISVATVDGCCCELTAADVAYGKSPLVKSKLIMGWSVLPLTVGVKFKLRLLLRMHDGAESMRDNLAGRLSWRWSGTSSPLPDRSV